MNISRKYLDSRKIKDMTVDELMEQFEIPEPTEAEIRQELLRRQLLAKLRAKNYYDHNAKIISQKLKDRKEKDPEKYSQKNKEYRDRYIEKNHHKIPCDCGAEVFKCNLNKHLYTKKHLNYLDKIDREKIVENIIMESQPIL